MVTGDSTQNLHLRSLASAPLLHTATRWPEKWSFINLCGRKDTKTISNLNYQRLGYDPGSRRVQRFSRDLRSPPAIFLSLIFVWVIHLRRSQIKSKISKRSTLNSMKKPIVHSLRRMLIIKAKLMPSIFWSSYLGPCFDANWLVSKFLSFVT